MSNGTANSKRVDGFKDRESEAVTLEFLSMLKRKWDFRKSFVYKFSNRLNEEVFTRHEFPKVTTQETENPNRFVSTQRTRLFTESFPTRKGSFRQRKLRGHCSWCRRATTTLRIDGLALKRQERTTSPNGVIG